MIRDIRGERFTNYEDLKDAGWITKLPSDLP